MLTPTQEKRKVKPVADTKPKQLTKVSNYYDSARRNQFLNKSKSVKDFGSKNKIEKPKILDDKSAKRPAKKVMPTTKVPESRFSSTFKSSTSIK